MLFSVSDLYRVLAEVMRGKAVSRALTNIFWKERIILCGQILDIGGAVRGSHYRFLDVDTNAVFKIADITMKKGVDFTLDITKEQVPLPEKSQDFILMFNILEHLYEHQYVLSEVRRLLLPGGKLIGTIPFLINVHPDPHDYIRFTKEALEHLFTENGFSVKVIEPIGRGPFLAGYEQLDMLIPKRLHLFFLPTIWFLDYLLSLLKPNRDFPSQFPLAYNFIVEKI